MADITTEEDLIELFNSLAEQHEKLKVRLEDALYADQNGSRDYPRKKNSYLGRIWRSVVIALLVNNRKNMLKYCREAESKLLQKLPALIDNYEEKTAIKKVLEDYDFVLKRNLDSIERTPAVQSSHKRTA